MAVERVVLIWNPALKKPGSGYLIGADLVLTARHVVFGKDELHDTARVIKMRTRAQAKQPGFKGWAEATCTWSAIEHDLALLRLQDAQQLGEGVPQGSVPLGPLPRDQWVKDVEAIGFPQFMVTGFPGRIAPDAARDALFARGEIRDPGQAGDERLPLAITTFGPNEAQRERALKAGASWWGGMSGAALCHHEAVVGVVVVDSSTGLDRSVLRVVPMRLVLANPEFRAARGLESAYRPREGYRADMITRLTLAEPVLAALCGRLGLAETAVSTKQQRAHEAIEGLLARDLCQGLEALEAVYDEFDAPGNGQRKEQRETVIRLALALAAAMADEQAVAEVHIHKESPDRPIFDLPCGLAASAEPVMAAVDGRAPEFLPETDERKWPSGKYRLEIFPEAGAEGGATSLGNLRDDVVDQFSPGVGNLRSRVADIMIDNFLRSPHQYPNPVQKLDMAKKHFAAASRKKTYYIAEPFDSSRMGDVEASLGQIKSDFQKLVMLRLSAGHEGADVERLAPLRDMLVRWSGGKA